MRYIKTYESFNYNTTNEGWLWGKGSIWSKIGNWFTSWKNEKMAQGAELFQQWAEKNPEKIEEMKAKLKPEFDKLSEEEKQELATKLENYKGEEAPADVAEAAEELVKVEEKLTNYKKGSKIYESTSLILEEAEQTLGKKILGWLGLSMRYIGIISMALSFLSYFASAMFAAAGMISAAVAIGPWVILGAFVGGAIFGILGLYLEYKANPDDPDFKPGKYKTGWESSGGPIM